MRFLYLLRLCRTLRSAMRAAVDEASAERALEVLGEYRAVVADKLLRDETFQADAWTPRQLRLLARLHNVRNWEEGLEDWVLPF